MMPGRCGEETKPQGPSECCQGMRTFVISQISPEIHRCLSIKTHAKSKLVTRISPSLKTNHDFYGDSAVTSCLLQKAMHAQPKKRPAIGGTTSLWPSGKVCFLTLDCRASLEREVSTYLQVQNELFLDIEQI